MTSCLKIPYTLPWLGGRPTGTCTLFKAKGLKNNITKPPELQGGLWVLYLAAAFFSSLARRLALDLRRVNSASLRFTAKRALALLREM